MARHKFEVGQEVAIVVKHSGEAWAITKIAGQVHGGDDMFTRADTRGSYPTRWSKTGLSRDRSRTQYQIVPVTNEHRATIWARDMRYKLADRATWADVTPETMAAVARLLGLPVPEHMDEPAPGGVG